MARLQLASLTFAIAVLASPLTAQQPTDLQVQLRSSTGSNRFQVGEVIPIETVFSSTTPDRYLEPCELFSPRRFGNALCRFSSPWSFSITPDKGWVELSKETRIAPPVAGGPVGEVSDRDLAPQPAVFPYELTSRFRFDIPGEYRVRFSTEVALDDESTPRRGSLVRIDPEIKPHTVAIVREFVLQIVPADPNWQMEVIRKGYEAYTRPGLRQSAPPSPEQVQRGRDARGLCVLGTPEAARVLAKLLARGHSDIRECLEHSPAAAAAIEEMQRLFIDPDVGVNQEFFSELVGLQLREDNRAHGEGSDSAPRLQRREWDRLAAALGHKHDDALVESLYTLLWNSLGSENWPVAGPAIAGVVANWDRISLPRQQWILKSGWGRVRSPLVLPLVRRLAEAGNQQALLRWWELDPGAAAAFADKEVPLPASAPRSAPAR
jgi:hypothetical protein